MFLLCWKSKNSSRIPLPHQPSKYLAFLGIYPVLLLFILLIWSNPLSWFQLWFLPQCQSPVNSWLLDSFTQISPKYHPPQISKQNSSSTPNLSSPFNLNGCVFYLTSKYHNSSSHLSKKTIDMLPLTFPLSIHPWNLRILPPACF